MTNKIKVLQVVNIMDRAGLETMLMNYYRNIDLEKVQFDFLTHRDIAGAYDSEIKEKGGKVFHAPRLVPKNYIKYFIWMKKFFKENKYDIVHSHIDTMSFFPLLAAKLSGIKVRIAHSHSSKLDFDIKLPIKFIAKLLLPFVSNVYFACGEKAGKFLFKNRKFEIVRNACDTDLFKYDESKRKIVRKNLKLNDKVVIGHVGRYNYIKNQLFILDIFNEYLKLNSNSHLILIGKGPNEMKIREKIVKLNLKSKVTLLIDRNDVNDLYQAMDVFVMPSLFEGLPLVAVEAQINGLRCIVSDNISKEVMLTQNISMLSLKKDALTWANEIYKSNLERNTLALKEITNNGYDIKNEAKELLAKYKKYLDKKGEL